MWKASVRLVEKRDHLSIIREVVVPGDTTAGLMLNFIK